MYNAEAGEMQAELVLEQELTWKQKNALMGGTEERPAIMKLAVPIYDHEWSKHPDRIRVSFMDGSTAVYELRTDQPHPLVLKNIEIMKATRQNIKQGYVNQPQRKWRKNRK